MKSTREILIEARALIERGWTQNHYAKDAMGAPCGPGSAVCYCALGAIYVAADCDSWEGDAPGYDTARDALRRFVNDSVWLWNDAPGRTQSEVLDAFDRAIAAESDTARAGGCHD